MNVIYGIGRIKRKYPRPVIAIGVFDGLHRGHQLLIKKTVARAKAIGGTSMVFTFFPHPMHTIKPKAYLPFLISLRHRVKLIKKMNVDVCVIANFSKSFSKIDPETFAKRYLARPIYPKEIYVGMNFRFGKNQSGDVSLLKKIGKENDFRVNAVPSLKSGPHIISSTRIRSLVKEGRLQEAHRFLGRYPSILGRVRRGDGRGRGLGFPTANLNPLKEIIPPLGVYLASIELNDKRKFYGIVNIGTKPSFKKNNKTVSVEVHIFNFHKNIYGHEIEISFLKKIRDEKYFASKKLLVEQLKKDKKKAKAVLYRIKIR